ncbi:RNA-binding (RRM/RBD/RNP motifs) family protein [Tasmannia lanceolata]|uniref:RNA-binding (RRM/RBD/RNP motifs) family protein n=1 Tax=Tasmannia lanceolata TaxID=3420 RepID=UPI0040647576
MAAFSSISSSLLPSNIFKQPFRIHSQTPKPPLSLLKPAFSLRNPHGFNATLSFSNPNKTLRINALAQEASVLTQDPATEVARRLYVGNIPRTVDNSQITKIFEEHGSVEKAEVMYDKYSGRSRRFAFVTMRTVEDANAATEKLDGSEIGGRKIKVNVTEKPLLSGDLPILQAEESKFIDSPYKVYVGNLAKAVTSDTLTQFFSEKGKVLSAKVSTVPGTSKSSGFGFVSFSSEEDVETAISSFNNAILDGQKIRVNKA